MKSVIILCLLLSACAPTISFETVCEIKDYSKFREVFSICMAGQRKSTMTDDADDFVKECRFSAMFAAQVCHREMTVYSGQEAHRKEYCKSAVYPEHIFACKEAGFVERGRE